MESTIEALNKQIDQLQKNCLQLSEVIESGDKKRDKLLKACQTALCVLDELTGIMWQGPGGKARQVYAHEIKQIEKAVNTALGREVYAHR